MRDSLWSSILTGVFVLVLQTTVIQGRGKCLSIKRDYNMYGEKPPLDYLNANNYGKKTQRSPMAPSRGILGDAENEDACPIGVNAVNSSITELPATSCSAIISTHIGDYIAYCAQEPASKILTYELNCSPGLYGSVIGNVPLVTETINPIFHLEPVDDLISAERPRQLVIALSRNAYSSAFEVLTENNFFSLSPCRHVFEYKHLTRVSTLPIQTVGTVIAFSNNNPESDASHNQKLAPVYIAHAGKISFCGLADVEHTTGVTLWYREDQVMITYIQKVGRSRRCVLRNFEIIFDENNQCQDVIPWKDQSAIGNAIYNGTTDPLAVTTEPFTIDHFLCGCEAVTAVQNESLTYLVVGLANSAPLQDDGLACADEEKISFNGSATDNTCACRFAQNVSFVLPYNKITRTFNYHDYYDASTFQILANGPTEVTEVTPLLLKDCCLAFQVASDRNDTRLYTVDMTEVDGIEKPRVDHFLNIDLPPYVEKTAWGYCSEDTIFLSYTREGFISGDSIFKLQCKMDDFNANYDFLRSDDGYRGGGRRRENPRNARDPTSPQRLYQESPLRRRSGQNGLPRTMDSVKSDSSYDQSGYEDRDNSNRPRPTYSGPRTNGTSRRLGNDDPEEQNELIRPPIVYQMPVITDAHNMYHPSPVAGNRQYYQVPQYGPPSNYGPVPRYQGPLNPNAPVPFPGAWMGNQNNRTGPLGPYGPRFQP